MPEEHNGGAKGPWGEVGKRTGRAEREVSQRTYQKEEKDSVGKRLWEGARAWRQVPGWETPAELRGL